jgi:plasmid stability protein
MASLLLRDVNEQLKRVLRIRAAQHGRSMSAEAMAILHAALNDAKDSEPKPTLAEAVRQPFAKAGFISLELSGRNDRGRVPPDFGA